MALQADLLESIPQTRYLSAENYISYRAIMRTFYLEYQKMHYQLDKDTIWSLLHKDSLLSHTLWSSSYQTLTNWSSGRT